MTVAPTVLTADTVPGDRYDDMPVVTQRQVPLIPNVQKTVEVPQIQYVDKIVEAPVVVTHQPVPVDAEELLRVEDVSIGRRLSPGREGFPRRPSLLTGNTVSSKGERVGVKWTRLRERHAAGEDLDLAPERSRRMVEFLVRRERNSLDVKADVAIRRLERLERENLQLEDEVLESSLPEALADKTKVVMLLVDKLVRRQRLRLWQSSLRRSRLHPRQ